MAYLETNSRPPNKYILKKFWKTWMEGVRAAMKTRHLEADQWLNRKEWCLGSGRRRQLSQDRKDR